MSANLTDALTKVRSWIENDLAGKHRGVDISYPLAKINHVLQDRPREPQTFMGVALAALEELDESERLNGYIYLPGRRNQATEDRLGLINQLEDAGWVTFSDESLEQETIYRYYLTDSGRDALAQFRATRDVERTTK